MSGPVRKGRIIATTVGACLVVGYCVMKVSSPSAKQVNQIRTDIAKENTDRYLAIRTSNQAAMATILGNNAVMSNPEDGPKRR